MKTTTPALNSELLYQQNHSMTLADMEVKCAVNTKRVLYILKCGCFIFTHLPILIFNLSSVRTSK